ncbi:MAG TPA: polysaccharide biosynthesis tyrosine autokinase [Pyrinomonadaceae bacterium]|nr:polysaccharide biosynthesis tyrosine autokinase [Pyrinomonadaceae bacterium]
MVSPDNRLLPLTNVERELDRPLHDVIQPKSYGASQTDTPHLREYIGVVLKRRWLILSLVVVVTSLVAIQMYRMPSIYQSTATILIEPKKASVTLPADKAIVINQEDPGYYQTQLRLLQSPALARQVILSLNLQNNPAFFGQSSPGILASLKKVFSRQSAQNNASQKPAQSELPIIKEAEVRDQLTPEQIALLEPYEDTLIANMTVESETGTSLVKISYRHTNPEMARLIANTVAEVFILNNYDRETQGSKRAAELISKELADLQLRIRQKEEEKLAYASSRDIPAGKEAIGANIYADRLTKLNQQLLDAEEKRKNAESLYNSAKNQSDPNAVPQVIENKRIQALREKLDQLKAQREELLVVYTEEYPAVKRINAQIENIENTLKLAPREVVSSLKTSYEAALANEQALRRDFEATKGVTSQQNLSQIQLNMIEQQLETDKQYAAMLLQRQRELSIKDNDRTNNISVVNVARPGALVGPPRLRNVLIAFVLALAAGVGLAFLLDYLDDSLKSVEDVDRYLHLPALALIPASRSDSPRLRSKNPVPDESEVTALALINDARSPAAEAYRHLRTSLLLSSAGQPPKTILVTSSQPSEGKTTTAVNTAVMLAQTGAEVLIIDCDLRRPRVHAHFGVGNVPGLTNYLSGESDLDSVLQTNEKLPQLKLLASGPIPPNPAELLGSNEMRKLLLELADRFTHVIIDSPPAISFTDASVLSTLVDGVVLVVHGGRSSRAVVRRAKQQLVDVGANIFGIVLNNVKLEAQDYYYYGGYYSSYYASADDAAETEGAARSAGAGGSA